MNAYKLADHNTKIRFLVALMLSVMIASTAHADVAGMIQSAATSFSTWVRAGGIIFVIIMGVRIIFGSFNMLNLAGTVIGLCIAFAPEEILSWVG